MFTRIYTQQVAKVINVILFILLQTFEVIVFAFVLGQFLFWRANRLVKMEKKRIRINFITI